MEWLTHFISRTKRQKPLHGSTICNVQEGNVLSSHVIVMVLGLITVKQKLQLYANQKVTILKSNTNIKHVSKAPFSFNSTIYMMPTNRSPNFQRGTINQKHHPDLGSDASSVWNFCARFLTSFGGETSGSFAKCRLFSQANVVPADRNVQLGSSIQDQMLRLPCYL